MSQNIEKKQIDLIEESICVYKTCNRCIDLHKKGELSFDAIEDFVDDRGRSCLYRLKQMCHDLFRNTDQVAYKEKFYDITVGYIFHEAMKLRECIYQLEYYRPEYNHLLNSHELTPAEKKLIHEFDVLISKADKRVAEGLKEIKILLKELVAHVRELLKIYRDNYLLPRFILENERSFIMIYGKTGYQDLLEDVYDRGRNTLMFKAAVSYLQSEYYQIARGLFHKVVHTDRNNAPAKFLFLYTSAYNCYLRNRISMAKIFAEEALTVPLVRSDGMDRYKESLRKLVPELTREMKKLKQRGKEENNRAYL